MDVLDLSYPVMRKRFWPLAKKLLGACKGHTFLEVHMALTACLAEVCDQHGYDRLRAAQGFLEFPTRSQVRIVDGLIKLAGGSVKPEEDDDERTIQCD